MSQQWSGWPSKQDYLKAKQRYSTLAPMLYQSRLVGFTVELPGVVGGGSTAKIRYKVYITLANCPTSPPEAWITHPKDDAIKHRNVWHIGRGSPQAKLPLPFMCLGSFASNWSRNALGRATTFLSFLDQVYNVLNNENPKSPARS